MNILNRPNHKEYKTNPIFAAMKITTSILLLVALLVQTLSLPFMAFQLETQREEVAVPMCVNRDVPDSDCLGSCYISSQMADALDTDPANTTLRDVFAFAFSPFLHDAAWGFRLQQPWETRSDAAFSYLPPRADAHTGAPWHPPRG